MYVSNGIIHTKDSQHIQNYVISLKLWNKNLNKSFEHLDSWFLSLNSGCSILKSVEDQLSSLSPDFQLTFEWYLSNDKWTYSGSANDLSKIYVHPVITAYKMAIVRLSIFQFHQL